MSPVDLSRSRWTTAEELGAGGFGKVVAATRDDGFSGALKYVMKAPGAERELLLAEMPPSDYIVPVVDTGETTQHFILAMPRCERSLRDHLLAGPGLPLHETLPILADIARGLMAIDGRVVHRDLKPENVLLLDGRWCLTDFGISRYAEAATSTDTRKLNWSAHYAAPEQWRHEHASSATDVYAFGVMAFELLTGSRPFAGPSRADLHRQHLNDVPSTPGSVPLALAALISECLIKAPEARPTPHDILRRLERAAAAPVRTSRLQSVNAALLASQAQQAAQASTAQTEAQRRAQLFDACGPSLAAVLDEVVEAIADDAPAAKVAAAMDGVKVIVLGPAKLTLNGPLLCVEGGSSPWKGSMFEVVATATMELRVPTNRYGYAGRSHSLWFCDAQVPGQFRWYETAFMHSPLLAMSSELEPFALPPANASGALGPGMNTMQCAWPFTPLVPGDVDEFRDRWLDWLARAAEGALNHPSTMPERDPAGSWRRS